MDPLLNPFRPGAGAPPPILAGRERELEEISILLGRLGAGRGERSIVLTGLRGVGKTALLWEAEAQAERDGWIPQGLEARSDLDFRSALTERAWVILRQLEHRGAVRETLGRMAAMIRRLSFREPESGLELTVSVDPGQREGRLEADIVELFRAIGEAVAEVDSGVLLLLDEMQLVERSALEALCAAMHDLSKRDLPLAALIAGLPPLRDQLLAAKTYAERLFSYRRLGPLSRGAATAALVEPAAAAGEGLEFEDAALARTLEACHGYPYFIQVYGYATWQVAEGPLVTTAVADAALSLGRDELDRDLYEGRWMRASEKARSFMARMAALGDEAVESGSVAEPFGGHRAVAPLRDRLIADGLIFAPARGRLQFTVPGFAAYIRRLTD